MQRKVFFYLSQYADIDFRLNRKNGKLQTVITSLSFLFPTLNWYPLIGNVSSTLKTPKFVKIKT